jgi:aconitate hydratase
VVAYALAGTTDVDLLKEPIGKDRDGKPVMLSEIWPSQKEVAEAEAQVSGEMFERSYGNVFDGNPTWNAVSVPEGDLFDFRDDSTYIQDPPFFAGLTREPAPLTDIVNARVLAILGDSVTTDHISPAGDIALASPAGRFLKDRGVEKKDFNSYGSRRGNDRVMVRGTFANIRLKNAMVPGVEGGVTVHQPSGERMDIYDAALRYRKDGVPLVILAGKEYGSGSSRDWAAKGTLLLGARAVVACSFERIHRSNLVGMGVLPLVFQPGQNAESLGLTGAETVSLRGLSGELRPRQDVTVEVTRADGTKTSFTGTARLDTAVEIGYYKNGGILQTVLRKMLRA